MEQSARGWLWPKLDHNQAAHLLSARAGEVLADELSGSVDPSQLVPCGEGDFYLALRCGTQVLRVAKHRQAEQALVREACVLAEIADRLSLPVPRTRVYEVSGCPRFSIHRAIDGEVLTKGTWSRLDRSAQQRLACEIAHFLESLHDSIPDPATFQGCRLSKKSAQGQADKLRQTTTSLLFRHLDGETRRGLEKELDAWAQAPPQRQVVIHSDLAPGHVFFDSSRHTLTGVIDFADIEWCEPARDFIYFFEDFGIEFGNRIVEVYAPGDAHFRSQIRKWLMLEGLDWATERGPGSDKMPQFLRALLDLSAQIIEARPFTP